MELRQLQHFVAVAEENHFTRAAQRVNIVQSALSASIRALEDELGAQLFIRSTRQVRLTTTGRVFLDKARAALEAVREARNTVAAMNGLEQGTLSIGTVQSLPAFLDLPSLLARFHTRHPGVEVRLCQGSTTHLLEKIRSGRIDLAFLPLCEPPVGITTTMIACESLVMICALDHDLAGRDEVLLHALKDEPFVDFEPNWGTRKLVDRAFLEVGIERRSVFEVSDLETLLELVARGLGIALVPETIAEARRSSLNIAPIGQTEICWELVVAYAAGDGTSPYPPDNAPRAFLELLASANSFGGGLQHQVNKGHAFETGNSSVSLS
ncbi:LysR family transcriptional regulator [Mesorhizobium escarrei]|uniref:LysR family transcriptional regulator n=1 Tax=Mesorhizobium escarrei TaxID=666018 RepID=A0ABN8JCM0_9HYPH|nr:LysR substrate-binding domain-containing protein [Mesorhizobium escarrei]CAH2395853.1 LysR family transcriptional regulator [Mesorhizobium escarrei]